MHLARAVEILQHLRDGEDPRTGRALPAASPAHEPEVIRALYTVLGTLPGGGDAAGAPVPAPRPPKPQPTRAGRPWTDEEDARLTAGFDGGETVGKLARSFGRSLSAIRLRLVKLGRLSAEDVLTGRSRAPRQAEPVA